MVLSSVKISLASVSEVSDNYYLTVYTKIIEGVGIFFLPFFCLY